MSSESSEAGDVDGGGGEGGRGDCSTVAMEDENKDSAIAEHSRRKSKRCWEQPRGASFAVTDVENARE